MISRISYSLLLLLTLAASASGQDLTTNLAAYFKLDESSGNAEEEVAGADLTANGSPGTTTGVINGARDLDSGSSQWFVRADDALFSTGDIDFSFSVWCQLASKPAVATVFGKFPSSGSGGEYTLLYRASADRWEFTVTNGTSFGFVRADTLGAPSTGVPYHIVCVHHAGDDTIKIYVNGGAADNANYSGGSHDSADDFALGQLGEYTTGAFDGWIDEFGFWKGRALEAPDVANLYHAGAGLAYEDLDRSIPAIIHMLRLISCVTPQERLARGAPIYFLAR